MILDAFSSALSRASSISILIFSKYVSIELSNSFLDISILTGPFGPSIISEAFSFVERSLFIFSATSKKERSFTSILLPFDFLYFLFNKLRISLSKSWPPNSLSPTEVITSTFFPLTLAIVISNVPPPKSNISTLPFSDIPGRLE